MHDCSDCKHCPHYFELLTLYEDAMRRLRYYENPNSPPSANSLVWRKQKKERREGRKDRDGEEEPKPGRKKGHEGVSHSFKPSETFEHAVDECTKCGSSDIAFLHQENRLIVEVPEPHPYTVTLHRINVYECSRCGSEVKPFVDIPENRMLGRNLLAMVTALWSEARLPIRKIIGMLKAVYDLKLSTKCINDSLLNVAESLHPLVNRIKSNINNSGSAGFDETGMSINGKRGWAWAAVSNNGKNAFITVEYSRGADVLERYFHTFDGIAVVDGWKAYSIFKQQRCWAHIIREADTIAARIETDEARVLASSLKQLYHDIKAELKEHHPPPNRSLYRRAINRFKHLLRKRYRNDDARKFIEKLKNAGKSLFTFIMHNVDSTNNDCEGVIREVVIHRKIRGLFRNGKGMKMFGNIMTAVMTWKLRGLNPLEEVRKYL